MIRVEDKYTIKTETSSRGNQKKFYKDGVWVKIDNERHSEGLAEEFVSLLEQCIYDFPHVDYKSTQIEYNDEIYNGCYSYNMYNNPNITFISLRHLFRNYDIPLNICFKEDDTVVNMMNVINTVGNITGLDITDYLRRNLLLDSLIINEDRHLMNLGVCYDGNRFYLAPCFDNGSSLFCTNWTYRQRKTLEENIISAKSVARPFSKFYEVQTNSILQIQPKKLILDRNKVHRLLEEYDNQIYNSQVILRMKKLLEIKLNSEFRRVFEWA